MSWAGQAPPTWEMGGEETRENAGGGEAGNAPTHPLGQPCPWHGCAPAVAKAMTTETASRKTTRSSSYSNDPTVQPPNREHHHEAPREAGESAGLSDLPGHTRRRAACRDACRRLHRGEPPGRHAAGCEPAGSPPLQQEHRWREAPEAPARYHKGARRASKRPRPQNRSSADTQRRRSGRRDGDRRCRRNGNRYCQMASSYPQVVP